MKRLFYILCFIVTVFFPRLVSPTVSAEMVPSSIDPYTYFDDISVSKISLGMFHTAVISSEGRLYIWGLNSSGQLGDETITNRLTPMDITDYFGLVEGEVIIDVSLGFEHSAAVTSKGRVFTWGWNGSGQLGDGTITHFKHPIDITNQFHLSADDMVRSIELGPTHSAAITAKGRVFTWGWNGGGQLGDGTIISSSVPIDITDNFSLHSDETIIHISLGYAHTSAISSEGRLFTWGWNDYGQLGDNGTVNRSIPFDCTSLFSLESEEKITFVDVGYVHSAAVTSNGRVFTWGYNSYGQLGDGTTISSNIPIDITNVFPLHIDEMITSISLGNQHTVVTSTEGRVFTWGWNGYGQLGDGTKTNTMTPVDISGNFELATDETILYTTFGDRHSAAITSLGNIFTWGRNSGGQLGDGTTEDKSNPNVIYQFNIVHIQANSLPFSNGIYDVTLGSNHTVVRTPEGRIFTWGSNSAGQLGNGTVTISYTPYEITDQFAFDGDETIALISTGSDHTATLTSSGKLYMWGYNHFGQIGDGTLTNRLLPIDITDKFYLANDETILSVDLGWNSSSILTSQGRVFTWGYNQFGQLGDGTEVNKVLPVEITSNFDLSNDETITMIAMGNQHALSLTSNGRVFTWGANYAGQLGDGTTVSHNVPVDITNQFNLLEGEHITKIAAGHEHSAVLTSTGHVLMWGANYAGQLGDGTYAGQNILIDITSQFNLLEGEYIIDVTLGTTHSSALTSTGRVFMWGSNRYGELGDNTITTKPYPIDITARFVLPDTETILAVELGNCFSAAISSSGKLFMWGRNGGGQLGTNSISYSVAPVDVTPIRFLRLLSTYSSGIVDSVNNTITVSLFPEFEITEDIECITINNLEYTNITNINGRIDIEVENIWKRDEGIILNINAIRFRNGLVITNILGDTITGTVLIGDAIPPTFDVISNQFIEVGSNNIDWTYLITNVHDNTEDELIRTEVMDTIDYDTIGTYTVIVSVADQSGNETFNEFQVTVQDTTAPIIELDGEATIYVEYGEEYVEIGSSCKDNYDQTCETILSGMVYDAVGEYIITYSAVDTQGNETLATRTIIVQDTIAPVVWLNVAVTTIFKNDIYVDTGISYEELSNVSVQTVGEVDATMEGIYTITYHVADENGNVTSISRKVHVVSSVPSIRFELGTSATTFTVGTDYQDGTCTVYVDSIGYECNTLSNNVNVNIGGIYTVVYSYNHNGVEYLYYRYVFVTNDKTIFTLYYILPRKEGEWY